MQVPTGARRAPTALAAFVATVAAMLALAPASPAAGAPKAHAQQQQHPHTQHMASPITTVALVRVAGWAAGPVARGTGYHRQDGSRRVREVQRRLSRLGYAPGPLDGRFGPRTEQATRDYQQARGLIADGVVGGRTLAALRRDSAGHRAVADWSAGPVAQGTGYRHADGSLRVREVQWELRSLGYATGPVDGRFGPRTAAAVRRFQAQHALPVNGRVGVPVLAALRARVPHATGSPATASPPSAPSPASPPAARTPQVRLPDVDRAPSLPLAVVSIALAALGVLTVAAAYGRTGRRIRTAQRDAELRSSNQHGLPAPPRADGLGTPPPGGRVLRLPPTGPAPDGEEGR